jgi:hypothetical protein
MGTRCAGPIDRRAKTCGRIGRTARREGALTALPSALTVATPDRAKTLDVLGRWLAWYQDAVSEPEADDAWVRDDWCTRSEWERWARRAKSCSLRNGMPTARSTGIRSAEERSRSELRRQRHLTLTIPPSYRHRWNSPEKPADRFWEFEDANVNFAIIDGRPTDLARLSMVEFSLVYGNDWFIRSVSHAGWLGFSNQDVHGAGHLWLWTRSIGPSTNSGTPPWSVFNISGGQAPAGAFFLAPTLTDTIESTPIEEVALFRDEMANMVWGVRAKSAGRFGRSVRPHRRRIPSGGSTTGQRPTG